jgi:hypothetical protein
MSGILHVCMWYRRPGRAKEQRVALPTTQSVDWLRSCFALSTCLFSSSVCVASCDVNSAWSCVCAVSTAYAHVTWARLRELTRYIPQSPPTKSIDAYMKMRKGMRMAEPNL